MTAGVGSSNLPVLSSVDEIVGHQKLGSVSNTGRVPIDTLKTVLSLGGGILGAALKTDLNGMLNYPAKTVVMVLGDTAENNGTYLKVGEANTGSYTRTGEVFAGILTMIYGASLVDPTILRRLPALLMQIGTDTAVGRVLRAEDATGGGHFAAGVDPATSKPYGVIGGLMASITEDGRARLDDLSGYPVIEPAPAARGRFAPAEIRWRAEKAENANRAMRRRFNKRVQPLGADYVVIIVYGQSNGYGSQSHPQLSTTPVPGLFMLGLSERPTGKTATTWAPIGPATLNPYVATAALDSAQTTMLSQSDAAALAFDADAYGETAIASAMMNVQRQRADLGLPLQKFIVVNCAVPGASAAQLARGANPEYFNRIPSALQAIKSALPNGTTLSVGAVIINQGEADVAAMAAGTLTPAVWRSTWAGIVADIGPYGWNPIFGQGRPPVVHMVQTGGFGIVNSSDMQMPETQRQTISGLGWSVSPRVDYASRLHMDTNGARRTGLLLGKALSDIFRREFPIAVQPLEEFAIARGDEILIPFMSPAPLELRAEIINFVSTTWTHGGLKVIDADGVVPILSVEISEDCCLRIKTGRTLVRVSGNVTVTYGERNISQGRGMIVAKDGARNGDYFPEAYQYLGNMEAAANNPDLVGKAYDSATRSLLFSIFVPVEV